MRRALGYAAIWCGATVVAISVAWFGVRDVLSSEFFDDVRILPMLAQTSMEGNLETMGTPGPRSPSPTSTLTPTPRRTSGSVPTVTAEPAVTTSPPVQVRRSPPAPATAKPPTQPPKQPPTQAPVKSTPTQQGDVKVIKVTGGEVAFTLGAGGCTLVSATPASGYTTKVTESPDGWIRVDLVQGEHGSAVFCIGSEQRTDTWEY